MSEHHVVVLVTEEYGYGYWLWDTHMSGENLKAWWVALATVRPYFMSPAGLPGDMASITGDEYDHHTSATRGVHWKLHIHMDDDSVLVDPTGKPTFHKGYEGS